MSDKDDCISRQMAIDTIMGQPPEPHYPSWYAAQVEKLPAVRPEIIRCKDCRWNDGAVYCEMYFRFVKGDDFCSWAERRTE